MEDDNYPRSGGNHGHGGVVKHFGPQDNSVPTHGQKMVQPSRWWVMTWSGAPFIGVDLVLLWWTLECRLSCNRPRSRASDGPGPRRADQRIRHWEEQSRRRRQLRTQQVPIGPTRSPPRWGENLMEDVELTRMDRRLAEKAQRPGELGLVAKSGGVIEQGKATVDGRLDPGRTGRHHQIGPRIEGAAMLAAVVSEVPMAPVVQHHSRRCALTPQVRVGIVTVVAARHMPAGSEVLIHPAQDVRDHDHRVRGDPGLPPHWCCGVLHAVGQLDRLHHDASDRLIVLARQGVLDVAADGQLRLVERQFSLPVAHVLPRGRTPCG